MDQNHRCTICVGLICQAFAHVGAAGRGYLHVIARCTMLLTGAPLELNHADTQNKYDGSISLIADQKFRAIAHFYTIKTS